MPPPSGEQVSPRWWCLCIKLQAVTLQKSVSSNSLPWLSLISHAYCIFYVHGILWLGWRGFFSGRVYSQNMGRLYLESPHFRCCSVEVWLTMMSIKQNIEQWILNCLIPLNVKILDSWKYKATWENVIILVTRNNKCMNKWLFFNLNKVVCGCVWFVSRTINSSVLLFRVVCLCSETLFLVCVFFTVALLCDSPVIAVHTQTYFMLQALGTSHLKEWCECHL